MFFQDNRFGWRRASNADALLEQEFNLFKKQVATALDEYFSTQGKVDSFDYGISKNMSGKSIGRVTLEYTPYVGQGELFVSASMTVQPGDTIEGSIRITYGKMDPKFDPYQESVKTAMSFLYMILMGSPKGIDTQEQLYFYFKNFTSIHENLKPDAKPISRKPVVKTPKQTPILETETATPVRSKFTGFKPERKREVKVLDPNETQYLTKAMVNKFPKEVDLTGFYDEIVGLPYYTSEFSQNGISLQDAIKRAIPNKIINRGTNIRYGLKSYVKDNIIAAFSEVIGELGGDLGHETLTQASNEEIWVSAKSAVSSVSLYYTFYNMKLTVLRSPGDNARWNKVKIRNEDIASGFQEIPVDFSWTKSDYIKQIKSNKSMINLLNQIVNKVPSPKAILKAKPPVIQEPVILPPIKSPRGRKPIIQAPVVQTPIKSPRGKKPVVIEPTLSPVKPIPGRSKVAPPVKSSPTSQYAIRAFELLNADLELSNLSPQEVYIVINAIKPITDKMSGASAKPSPTLSNLAINKIINMMKTLNEMYDLGDLSPTEADEVLGMLKPLMDKVPNLSFKKKAFWF